MNELFVPYQQALALKELGFDEPCIKFYWTDGMFLKDFVNPFNYNKRDSAISAPLYQQAFRWFRENHDLHSGIYPYYDRYEFQIKDFRLPTNTPINGGMMPYEKAELECLIKLIELVKSGSLKA